MFQTFSNTSAAVENISEIDVWKTLLKIKNKPDTDSQQSASNSNNRASILNHHKQLYEGCFYKMTLYQLQDSMNLGLLVPRIELRWIKSIKPAYIV